MEVSSVHNLADKISIYLYERGVIKKEDREIYTFGAEVALDFLIIFLLICFFGIVTGQVASTLIFLVVYCSLRGCGGGYHASTYARCCLCSVATYLSVVCLGILINPNIESLLFLPIILVGSLILFVVAPTDNLINPKSEKEKQKNRKKLLKRMTFINIFTLICYFTNFSINIFTVDIKFIISCSLMSVAILSLINSIQNYHIGRRSIKWE